MGYKGERCADGSVILTEINMKIQSLAPWVLTAIYAVGSLSVAARVHGRAANSVADDIALMAQRRLSILVGSATGASSISSW